MTAAAVSLTLLGIPLEIRELIYDALFLPTLRVEIKPAPQPQREYDYGSSKTGDDANWHADFESWAITPHPLSSQLLQVSQQFHKEALSFLYSHRVFDLTARESLKLLFHNIGPRNLSKIRHIVLDWEFLQTFAWDLGKDGYSLGLSGLKCIQLATWRIRHMYGTSVRWRNVKSYERMLLQAALEITRKHGHLKILAEQPYTRKGANLSGLETASNCRVKWRFVTRENDVHEGENIVDAERDLQILQVTPQEIEDERLSLSIDPF